ncbi:TauD/TfdA family dioxygenase [Nitrospirillum viridazoti]|nr:TauD/TfdA family dioxygenase [Nitrospirillum amazonense]TWB44534.1 alpha-ketoglutarate-dependent taurine dioxygenase [Nitrospirillum amazonense]
MQGSLCDLETGCWPPAGSSSGDWRISLGEWAPELAVLGTEAGGHEDRRAKRALDALAQLARGKLYRPPYMVLLTDMSAAWLEDGLAERIYLGLCERLGRLDLARGPFYDVYDRKISGRDHVRYSDTNKSHGFHTDGTASSNWPELVGLLCVRQASSGGMTRLVNIYNIHRRLLDDSPEVLEVLRRDLPRQTRSIPEGAADRSAVDVYPVLTGRAPDMTLGCRYMRRWVDAGFVMTGQMPSAVVVTALDAFDQCLESDPAMLLFRMRPGELVFLNNRVVLHDREAYQDAEGAPRLMRRAWLYGA